MGENSEKWFDKLVCVVSGMIEIRLLDCLQTLVYCATELKLHLCSSFSIAFAEQKYLSDARQGVLQPANHYQMSPCVDHFVLFKSTTTFRCARHHRVDVRAPSWNLSSLEINASTQPFKLIRMSNPEAGQSGR